MYKIPNGDKGTEEKQFDLGVACKGHCGSRQIREVAFRPCQGIYFFSTCHGKPDSIIFIYLRVFHF